MDHESYDIDITHIKDADKICWEYTTEPPKHKEEEGWQESGNLFYKLSSITESLAVASDYVHLDKIVPSNIFEWYYRLEALFDAGEGFLFTDTQEGEIPIRINLTDLKDHLGLRINTTSWEASKFDKNIRRLRMRSHLRNLL